jgi:transcriptional regulator
MFDASNEQLMQLIHDFPLASLVSQGDHGLICTPLPLLAFHDDKRALCLLGHFARSNPHIKQLQRNPQALVIFTGPHGYISPSWFTDRTQAPTWNYMTAHLEVEVEFDNSSSAAINAVDALTEHMEVGRPKAWSKGDMGERYLNLVPHVVAFRANVIDVRTKFKLGQNERLDVLKESIAGLSQPESQVLRSWMLSANNTRLEIDNQVLD